MTKEWRELHKNELTLLVSMFVRLEEGHCKLTGVSVNKRVARLSRISRSCWSELQNVFLMFSLISARSLYATTEQKWITHWRGLFTIQRVWCLLKCKKKTVFCCLFLTHDERSLVHNLNLNYGVKMEISTLVFFVCYLQQQRDDISPVHSSMEWQQHTAEQRISNKISPFEVVTCKFTAILCSAMQQSNSPLGEVFASFAIWYIVRAAAVVHKFQISMLLVLRGGARGELGKYI